MNPTTHHRTSTIRVRVDLPDGTPDFDANVFRADCSCGWSQEVPGPREAAIDTACDHMEDNGVEVRR